ncbi:MAG: acyltransferase domain-containing protein, partial [Phycisphaerales bacterium]|nr:acyltransferase domain-containing protein [Phycisphaerales bacterium]
MSERDATPTQTPIAIVGMACMFPNAQGLKQYWRLLRRTEDAIRDVPDTHWSLKDYYDADRARPDHTYCRRGGFLEPVKFDPVSFGIPPTVLEATDTAQLLSLMVARNALDDAGYGQSREFERERAGVILGVTGTQELVIPLGARLGHPHWRRAMIEAGVAPDVAEDAVRRMGDTYVEWQENSFPGLLGNVVAGRVANRLNLRGTNCVVDAACASSLSALHLAALELHAGRADMIVSGGVDALNDIFMFMCFSRTQALSEAGDARPFDANADGTVIGEGVGMLVLKRLADAQRDGDRVHAILRGVGAASDGRSQSIYAPLASGQALALRDAYRVSGVEPASIELVEAHGTGTKVGDAVEFEGLRAVYDDARDARQWCAVGSVKSQIGHTKAAAGAASLIKAVLALKQRVIPATAKVAEPHPKLDLAESPFFLPTKSRPWFADADHPRRAGVSSFGFGGSNFHAVLEETPTSEREAAWDGSVELIAISARNESELRGQLSEWRAFADSAADASDHARRAHASRDAFDNQSPLRLVIVAPRDVSLVDLIAEASNAIGTNGLVAEWHTPHVFFGGPQPAGDLALLFPGQGSQYVEMGRDLACVFPEAHDAIADASTAFNSAIDQRLSDYIFPTPTFDSDTRAAQERALTGTHVAQPAIGAVSVAMQNTLARFGVQPDCVAGHSFGELTALHAAGVIDEATLAGLAAERGAAMHAADDGAGAMLAVHAPVDEIEAALSAPDAPSDITLASRNAPRQAILSGPRTAIETAAAWLKNARGWPSTLLKVSAAFHTAVLEPAQRRFRAALDAVRVEAPRIPVFSNVTAGRYPLDPHAIRDLLARQLTRPVHFMDEIRRLYDAGVRTFVEVGPKNVLTNFVTQTLADLPHRAIALDGSCGQKCGVVDLARVLALLVVVGHAVDLHAWEGPPPPEMNYKMSVELIGANYRAPKKTETGERRGAVAPAPIGATQMNQKTNVSKSERAASRGANGTHTPAPPGDVADRNLTTRQGVLEGGPTPPVQANATIEEGLRALMALQQQTATAHQSFLNGQARLADTMRTLLGLPTTYGVSPTAP